MASAVGCVVERGGFVEIGVVEWCDHAIDLLFNGMKITQQFFLVELGATHRHENTPIVAVQGFPLALITMAWAAEKVRSIRNSKGTQRC